MARLQCSLEKPNERAALQYFKEATARGFRDFKSVAQMRDLQLLVKSPAYAAHLKGLAR